MSRIAAFLVLAACVPASAQVLGPDPYSCIISSPFQNLPGFTVETFEDGFLNIPGVIASAGQVEGPGALTDSVDCDDGMTNGSGVNGHSYFYANGSEGITFKFKKATLGGKYPSAVGIVWTDGGVGATVTFRAYNHLGIKIGEIVSKQGDGGNNGQTAEDRFYGATNNQGVSEIEIICSSGGIEVDHLQYAGAGDACYGDCDISGTLSIDDFICFQTRFAIGDPAADCDGNGSLNIDDFICFQTMFAVGC